jgi:hypothetical protein
MALPALSLGGGRIFRGRAVFDGKLNFIFSEILIDGGFREG